MKRLWFAISTMGLAGCVSQIFLDGPVEPADPAAEVRVVHVTPVPTRCPESGMGACYLVTDGQDGSPHLLQAPHGLLDYVAGSDYVVEITERRGGNPPVRWVVNRVVDHHPRAR
jgi:hypothetical protein